MPVSLRVPSEDSRENPFPEGIENFALPNGWQVESLWKPPLFHTCQLTKLDGSAYFAAFFTFYFANEHGGFEPLSLILVARHSHIRQLKNALILLYDKHIQGTFHTALHLATRTFEFCSYGRAQSFCR